MIVREDRDQIAVLRMDHGKVNAIDLELLNAVRDQLGELHAEPPRALVLTGTGGNFSAGLNLVRFLEGGGDYLQQLLPALDGALRALFTLPRPVIAAVNGHAIAGGFVLACACDYRIVAAGPAKLGITELLVGVPFPTGPLEMVRTVVGTRRTRGLAYSGRLFSGEEGRALGFTDELVDGGELLDRALAVAGRWGASPTQAFALTKRQLQQPTLDRLDRHAPAFDPDVARIWADPQVAESMRGFVAKTLKT